MKQVFQKIPDDVVKYIHKYLKGTWMHREIL
jgi:hypothetical protein